MPMNHFVDIVMKPAAKIFSSTKETLLPGVQVRDYIHVLDLAEGHIAALRKLFDSSSNIGLHN